MLHWLTALGLWIYLIVRIVSHVRDRREWKRKQKGGA